jgi:hypothetical protein
MGNSFTFMGNLHAPDGLDVEVGIFALTPLPSSQPARQNGASHADKAGCCHR